MGVGEYLSIQVTGDIFKANGKWGQRCFQRNQGKTFTISCHQYIYDQKVD